LRASTNKKVLVSRFERDPLCGFVNPTTYLTGMGLELLTVNGAILTVPYDEVKTVAFVREFQQSEPRTEMRSFTARPKMEGLWVRMRFRDGDSIEGVLANNLLQIDGLGFTIVPPDPGYQNQRLFIPRTAVTQVQVLGVVGSPLRTGKRKAVPKEQLDMFEKG
jgi:hypothetical protein